MRSALGMLILVLLNAVTAHAEDQAHRKARSAAFTMTNEVEGNRVVAFAVRASGRLDAPVWFDAGGKGTGDSLGSQGALVLSEDERYLIVVNAGSSELSVFEVFDGARLELRHRIASGGTRPISVTERCGLVYVVHAESDDVFGFRLHSDGRLSPIEGSHGKLSSDDAGPAQISLSPDARSLVVTEKTSNVITTYQVDDEGRLDDPQFTLSEGMTPFGFEFTTSGVLVVSEAASGSMSSYSVEYDSLEPISSVVPDMQMAPCWVEITGDDRVAYTANAGSASISSYEVSSDGELELRDARAGELGDDGTPLDLAFAGEGRYLLALDRGNTRLAVFAVDVDGGLSPRAASESGLPEFTTGLAAY